MSIQDRRNAALRSSISINSIRKSTSSFFKGITESQKTAKEINEQTKKNNELKRSFIRNDNRFFSKRRENVLRKEREDELEASSLQGSTKRQGNIVQRSTKGFLGRILDIAGIVIIGWFTTKLLPILPKLSGLINLIINVLSVGKKFTDSISTFIVDIEEGINKQFTKIPKKPELEQAQTEAVNQLEKTGNSVNLLNLTFFRLFQRAKNPNEFGLATFSENATVFSDLQYSEGGEGTKDPRFLPEGTSLDEKGNIVLPEIENNNNEEDEDEKNKIKQEEQSNDTSKEKENELKNIKNENNLKLDNLNNIEGRKDNNENLNENINLDQEENDKLDSKELDSANDKVINFFRNIFGFDPVSNKEISSGNDDDILNKKLKSSDLSGFTSTIRLPFEQEDIGSRSNNNISSSSEEIINEKNRNINFVDTIKKNDVNLFTERKRNKVIIVNKSDKSGGVNIKSSSSGGGSVSFNNNESNTLKKAFLLNIK